MKRTDKKGFTIVELVIVIAVIAILAAVLIPNISKLVRKANESSDLSLVRNLNTALSLETKDYATAHEAFEAVKDAGYDLTKIEAKADKNKILYDSENQCFAYLKDGKLEYYPNSAKTPVTSDNYYKLWAVCNNAGDIDTQFSVYWNGGNTNETLKVEGVGFDAGDYFVAGVEYTGTKQQTVTIRTNSGETNLTVNNDKATVNHYGSAGTVKVISVDASHSYHEFGSVKELEVTKGHIVLEKGSLIYDLKTVAGASATFVSSGTVIKNSANADGVTVAKVFEIDSLDRLCALRDYVNAGMDFSELPIEITADIDMSSISWKPIGTAENPFNGEIRGNGHTIKGLTNGTIKENDSFTTGTTKTFGSVYGFIGIVGAKVDNKTLTVTNLNFSAVNINMTFGNCVGSLIGYAPSTKDFNEKFENAGKNNKAVSDITITNVNVDASSSITVNQDAGGVCGKLYNSGNITIKNCTNKGSLTALKDTGSGRASGIVAYISPSGKDNSVVIDNCKNEGTITSHQYLAGIVSYGFVAKNDNKGEIRENIGRKLSITITNCANSGELVWTGVVKEQGEEKSCMAAFIATVSGTSFDNATEGCSYNFGNDNTKNVNTGKITVRNVTDYTPKCQPIAAVEKPSANSFTEAIEKNGKSETKSGS